MEISQNETPTVIRDCSSAANQNAPKCLKSTASSLSVDLSTSEVAT